MKIKDGEKKLVLVLLIILVIGSITIFTIIFEYQPFSKIPTGQVTAVSISEPEEYTGKTCFYNIGSETVSIYSCNEKIDCKNKISKLKRELKNFTFDLNDVSVIKCADFN